MPRVPEFTPRPDGRPEAFDVAKKARTGCDQCYLDRTGRLYGYGEIAILHALYSPYPHPVAKDEAGKPLGDGIHHHLCMGHLRTFVPNVVISDPSDGFLCRDLDGNTWREQ